MGAENNTRRNFNDLEEMLRSAKTLKRNNDFGASHGLPKDSVANVKSSPWTKISCTERAGKLPRPKLELLLSVIDVVFRR